MPCSKRFKPTHLWEPQRVLSVFRHAVRDTGPYTEAFRSWFAVFTAVAGNVKGEVKEGSVERIKAHGAVRCLYWDCGSAVF
jgi:hypothetical protein